MINHFVKDDNLQGFNLSKTNKHNIETTHLVLCAYKSRLFKKKHHDFKTLSHWYDYFSHYIATNVISHYF
jgi:hypothetical protein